MKIDVVLLLISLGISGLTGYGFYHLNSNDTFGILVAIVTGVLVCVALVGLLALKSKSNENVTNIKIVSGIFLFVFLITNGIFSFFNFSNPAAYIIINGVELLIYALIFYSIHKSLK